ncbi:AAA family ATPase [Brevibacillus sp. B_LB10_24]|uniref:AAA family ATPase n=1 Tax=Brevibacillus sp. B_LB10_24 TaxID=3380645 RepID=UPI0038BC3A26
MITGLFIRHYKIYQGLYFVPICSDLQNRYSMYIVNNGVGKSSILEALDTFFNNRQWNKNKDGKKDEAFIAPVFLIKKSDFVKSGNYSLNMIEFLQCKYNDFSSLPTDSRGRHFSFYLQKNQNH